MLYLYQMALFIRQDDNRSELQQRLAAELQERTKLKSKSTDLPDGVDDSQYLKGTKTTTSFAWIWIILTILVVILVIWLTMQSTKG